MASALHQTLPLPDGRLAARFAVDYPAYDADRGYGSPGTAGAGINARAERAGLSATPGCSSAQPHRDTACANSLLRRPNRWLRRRRAFMLQIKPTMRPTT